MPVCLFSKWLIIYHSLLRLLSGWYTHIPHYMSLLLRLKATCFFLSELTLRKTIHLVSNLCFCIMGTVFPVTLWFFKGLSGIHRQTQRGSHWGENYPNNSEMLFVFWAPTPECVVEFSIGCTHDNTIDWMQKQVWEYSYLLLCQMLTRFAKM